MTNKTFNFLRLIYRVSFYGFVFRQIVPTRTVFPFIFFFHHYCRGLVMISIITLLPTVDAVVYVISSHNIKSNARLQPITIRSIMSPFFKFYRLFFRSSLPFFIISVTTLLSWYSILRIVFFFLFARYYVKPRRELVQIENEKERKNRSLLSNWRTVRFINCTAFLPQRCARNKSIILAFRANSHVVYEKWTEFCWHRERSHPASGILKRIVCGRTLCAGFMAVWRFSRTRFDFL